MNKKKGISLIVLIITIVVVIILVAAVMSNLNTNDLISGANEATIKNNFKTFQEELNVFISKKDIESKGKFDEETLNADASTIAFNTKNSSSTETNIYDIIPSLENTEYAGKVTVINGKISFEGLDTKTNSWATEAVSDSSAGYGDAGTNNIVTGGNSTVNGKKPSTKNPVIPVGFKAVETTDATWEDTNSDGFPDGWNNGLVISDNDGNEFVWVPVDGTNVKYEKWCTVGIAYNNLSVEDTQNDIPAGVSESAQISKYGGFYIGRYEAGVPANQSQIDGLIETTSNVSGIPQIKKGTSVWACIRYPNASSNAKLVCNTNKVKSGLVTDTAWDTVCKWLQNSGYNVDDSSSWGNSDLGIDNKHVTGYSESWKANNIYDFAGNYSEIVTGHPKTSDRPYHRGEVNKPTSRYLGFQYDVIGFRVQLFIL